MLREDELLSIETKTIVYGIAALARCTFARRYL